MKSLVRLSLSLVLASCPILAAQESPSPAPTPAPKPFEDVIKLWKANLSEDFIKKQIETGTTVYDLSADEIIRCRDAGLPESLINTMIETKKRADAAKGNVPPPAPRPTAAAAVPPIVSGSTAPAPSANYAAEANRRWEGLARRNSGVVLFKSRWDVGTLEFKEETLRWVDAKNAGKNVLVAGRQMTEQYLTCLKKSGGNECFEWGFKTKDGDYKFRDVSWEQGENKKPLEIFEFMKAIYPNLVSSTVPVDSK